LSDNVHLQFMHIVYEYCIVETVAYKDPCMLINFTMSCMLIDALC